LQIYIPMNGNAIR